MVKKIIKKIHYKDFDDEENTIDFLKSAPI